MKNILILTDFSENSVNAYRYGVELACAFKANILLVFSTNGQAITLTNQMQYSQMLHSFAKRYACSSRLKANPHHTECLISGDAWSQAIPLLIQVHKPELLITGSDLFHAIEPGNAALDLKVYDNCPVILVPDKASFMPPKQLVFVTDFTDQDPEITVRLNELLGQFNASVSLVHFYAPADRKKLSEIKRAGDALKFLLKENCTGFYLIEEEDLVEGMEDFTAKHPVDLFVLATPDSHLATHYFQPVYRKTNSCQTAVPVLNLFQQKQKPCTGSCQFCNDSAAVTAIEI